MMNSKYNFETIKDEVFITLGLTRSLLSKSMTRGQIIDLLVRMEREDAKARIVLS